MKYKMVCIDMDGTLLNSRKVVSEKNREAIKKAKEKGVKVVVSTGRLFSNAAFYSQLLGVEAPVIAANGAVVRVKETDEIIYECVLEKSECYKILELINKYRVIAHFHTVDTIFCNSIVSYLVEKKLMGNNYHPNYKIKSIIVKGKNQWDEVFEKYEGQIVKCILFSFDSKKIKKFKEEVRIIGGLACFGSGRRSLEINAKNVSKGNAVEVLSKYLGINREDIICIGDNENDISMIEYAGLGVAMGNGIESLKSKADYITLTNDEDGVANVIDKFILN